MLTNYDTAKLLDLEDVMITNCHKTHSRMNLPLPELQHIFPKYYGSTSHFAFFLLEQLKNRRSIQDIVQKHSSQQKAS